ncbi:hypothetical protein LDT72_005151 [Salmonella enterica]|nr:hypothetical protein [Salmonella enterica]EIE7938956.1 hypothetical protein [Salmonella enterica]
MKYLPGIFFNFIVAALFTAGIGLNIGGATATVHGFLWVCAIAGLLAFLIPDVVEKTEEEYVHRTLLWTVYSLITDLATVAVTAWLNWYALAVFILLLMGVRQEFYRKQEKRLKEQAT